jgi:class 3 adenylate cyclase
VDEVLNRAGEERKLVTVLFCDLVAYTELAERLDPEALRMVMSEFFARAAAVVERHGGTVEKFVGDEVMGVFGVPVVHEDDALRAVRAAAAIRDCVVELDRETDARLEVRIGVNSGEVVAGDPASGHGFVSGDAVAVGKRLEQAAGPGEIVLGESTYALVAHAIAATPLAPLALKGKSGQAIAHRLESIDEDAIAIPRRADTPFAGHFAELERLRELWSAVAEGGDAALVTLVGEPGVGKSRLVRELISSLGGEATVLVGRCPPYGEGLTFSPVRELFRQAARPDGELEGSSFEVFAATRRLLEELAADRPVLVAFDDVQWAEETLLDLLEHLDSRLGATPVLVLRVGRPELAERRPQWLQAPNLCLMLEPLTALESDALLGALGVPDETRRRIAEMAEGNPLFIEQLAAFAREDAEVTLAGSIRGVLQARIDRLRPEDRAVLERASVLGRSFSLEGVLGLVPAEVRERVHGRLFDLARRGLVRADPAAAAEGFRFQHALIRDVVYESMPKAERAELHEAEADRLARNDEPAALIGFHLERAYHLRRELGRPDTDLARRAGSLLGRAASEATAHADAPAAIALLDRARAVLPADDLELPGLLTALGSARVNVGDLVGAEQALGEAIAAAAAVHDRAAELHARVELQFVRAFASASIPAAESVELAQAAIDELQHSGDELGLARAYWLRSSADVAACRWSARAVAIEQALAHARRAHAGSDMVGTLAGFLAQALLHGSTPVDEAIRRIEALTTELALDPALRGPVDTSVAGLLAMQGHFDDARRTIRDAAATYEEFGLRFRRATQGFVGAQIELLAGNPNGAEEELRRSTAALEEFGATSSAGTHRAMLADVLCTLGRLEESAAVAEELVSAVAGDDLVAQVLWRSALTRVRGRTGAVDEARALASESLALTAGVEFPYLRVTALIAAAEVEQEHEAALLLREARAVMVAKGNVAAVALHDSGATSPPGVPL